MMRWRWKQQQQQQQLCWTSSKQSCAGRWTFNTVPCSPVNAQPTMPPLFELWQITLPFTSNMRLYFDAQLSHDGITHCVYSCSHRIRDDGRGNTVPTNRKLGKPLQHLEIIHYQHTVKSGCSPRGPYCRKWSCKIHSQNVWVATEVCVVREKTAWFPHHKPSALPFPLILPWWQQSHAGDYGWVDVRVWERRWRAPRLSGWDDWVCKTCHYRDSHLRRESAKIVRRACKLHLENSDVRRGSWRVRHRLL